MKSLLKFELQKIFGQKSIYIVLIVLLGLITISLNAQRITNNSSYYKDWEGQLTQEKVERAEAEHAALMKKWDENKNLTDEERGKLAIYENISQLHGLEERRLASVEELSKRLNGENQEDQRQTKLELNMLEKLDFNKLYYNRAPAEMIDFVKIFGVLLSGALILVGLASLFSNEYATGMDQFHLSSKYGRTRDVTAKIIASFIYVIFVIGVWVVYNSVYRIVAYGNGGWKSPLQQLFQYRYSPYDFDLLSFIGVQIGMHTLAALGLALLVLLISAWSRNTLLSFLISGFIFALPIAINSIFKIDLKSWSILFDFSFTNIMIVYDLFATFKTINLFGMPILYPFAAITLTVILSAAFTLLLYWTMKRKQVA